MTITKDERDDYRDLTDRLSEGHPTEKEEEAAIAIESLLTELEELDPID